MSKAFSQYIKIIGKGKKGAKPLTREEAFSAMKMVLNGDVTGEQRGAFLMLLRTREETSEELIGFVDACRAKTNPAMTHISADIDIGCYAGKRRQLLWYLLAVACLVQRGQRIFLHGAQESGSSRLYASHVLPELGLPAVNDINGANAQLAQIGATYLDLSAFNQPLYDIIQLREQFGLRSCANTLARLLNPSQAPFVVQGVYHTHLDERHHHVNQAYRDYQALCFRGDGGDPEVNQERETDLYLTRPNSASVLTIPGAAQSWSLKDKALDVQTMLRVWRNEESHRYGEQAVIGSLTAYLILHDNLNVNSAAALANTLWQERELTDTPFSS